MNSDKRGINAITYLPAVDRFNIEEVVEECIEELARIPRTELEAATEYTHLSDKLKNKILVTRFYNLRNMVPTDMHIFCLGICIYIDMFLNMFCICYIKIR